MWRTEAEVNIFSVLHVLKLLVRPRCSQPSIHIVSLLNQQISLFLHSMFPLLSTSQTTKANHICDLLSALDHTAAFCITVFKCSFIEPPPLCMQWAELSEAVPVPSAAILLPECFFVCRTVKRRTQSASHHGAYSRCQTNKITCFLCISSTLNRSCICLGDILRVLPCRSGLYYTFGKSEWCGVS